MLPAVQIQVVVFSGLYFRQTFDQAADVVTRAFYRPRLKNLYELGPDGRMIFLPEIFDSSFQQGEIVLFQQGNEGMCK